jgi:hypothetical protein
MNMFENLAKQLDDLEDDGDDQVDDAEAMKQAE